MRKQYHSRRQRRKRVTRRRQKPECCSPSSKPRPDPDANKYSKPGWDLDLVTRVIS